MNLPDSKRKALVCVLCHHGVDEFGDRLCRYPTCKCIDRECVPISSLGGREIIRLRAALQALADAADARLHDPNWIPLLNARRVLERNA